MEWKQILQFFEEIRPIVEFVIAILWGLYVYFTIKTFREIHRQTELQFEAFLMVTCDTTATIPEKATQKIKEVSDQFHEKWKDIVKQHIPSAIGQDSYLTLNLTNKGKSDILAWTIKMLLEVNPGQYLKKKYNTYGEQISWNINSETSSDIIGIGQTITLLVAKIGAYPEGKFFWEINYSDMRNKPYETFSGNTTKTVKNSLAFDMKE